MDLVAHLETMRGQYSLKVDNTGLINVTDETGAIYGGYTTAEIQELKQWSNHDDLPSLLMYDILFGLRDRAIQSRECGAWSY